MIATTLFLLACIAGLGVAWLAGVFVRWACDAERLTDLTEECKVPFRLELAAIVAREARKEQAR